MSSPSRTPKTVKYRAHLDLATTSAAHQAELVARLKELGATPADVGQGDVPWTVLADPEGNVFCVLEPREIYRDTGPIAAVVVDCADPRAMARFWGEAMDWTLHEVTDDHARLRSAKGVGPYLEFLRTPDVKTVWNRVHLDLVPYPGDDQAAEVARLRALGATDADVGQGDVPWTCPRRPGGQRVLRPRPGLTRSLADPHRDYQRWLPAVGLSRGGVAPAVRLCARAEPRASGISSRSARGCRRSSCRWPSDDAPSKGSAICTASSPNRLLKAMPMRVMPRRSIIGMASPRRTRPAVSNASVSAVASGSVWDLVAREKSSNRRRSVTVRQTRCAFRSRRASRSTSAIRSMSSVSGDLARRPSARCVPIERRRRPTSIRRGSRLWASA